MKRSSKSHFFSHTLEYCQTVSIFNIFLWGGGGKIFQTFVIVAPEIFNSPEEMA